MRGDADDPCGAHVSRVRIHAHVHLISPAKGGHPARATGAIVSAVAVRVAAAAPPAAWAARVGPVSVVRFGHPRAQHAALLHAAEDLVDAEADGLHVQHPSEVHGRPRAPPAAARGTEVAPRAAPLDSSTSMRLLLLKLLVLICSECGRECERKRRLPPPLSSARGTSVKVPNRQREIKTQF